MKSSEAVIRNQSVSKYEKKWYSSIFPSRVDPLSSSADLLDEAELAIYVDVDVIIVLGFVKCR